MTIPDLLVPVREDDPCGPDLRWDPEFLRLTHMFDAASSGQDDAAVDAETVAADRATFRDIIDSAGVLSGRTKDLRILVLYAQAAWHDGGLVAFTGAMADLVSMVEAWPGHRDGIHPRADEEDGDLGERAAPLGRLLNQVPALADSTGWGGHAEPSQRAQAADTLREIFDAWSQRLEPAFDSDLPLCDEAWTALGRLLGDASSSRAAPGGQDLPAAGLVAMPEANAWDMIERAEELMVRQDHHSPALPILRMLRGWRDLDIMQIAERMKQSNLTLEQLLDSLRRQNENRP